MKPKKAVHNKSMNITYSFTGNPEAEGYVFNGKKIKVPTKQGKAKKK